MLMLIDTHEIVIVSYEFTFPLSNCDVQRLFGVYYDKGCDQICGEVVEMLKGINIVGCGDTPLSWMLCELATYTTLVYFLICVM